MDISTMKDSGAGGGRQAKARAWARHLAAWRRSGLSIVGYCRQHELAPSSFHYWRRKLESAPRSATGLRATQAGERTATKTTGTAPATGTALATGTAPAPSVPKSKLGAKAKLCAKAKPGARSTRARKRSPAVEAPAVHAPAVESPAVAAPAVRALAVNSPGVKSAPPSPWEELPSAPREGGFVALGEALLAAPAFELQLNGRALRVPMRFEEAALRKLLAILEGQPCG